MLAETVAFDCAVPSEHEDASFQLPVPTHAVGSESATSFIALCAIGDAAPERAAVSQDVSGAWRVAVHASQLRRAGAAPGGVVRVTLAPAPDYPSVLLAAVDAAGLGTAWDALSAAQRRDLAEPVFSARGARTREMWVAAALAKLNARGG
jgi:hypothetical protein